MKKKSYQIGVGSLVIGTISVALGMTGALGTMADTAGGIAPSVSFARFFLVFGLFLIAGAAVCIYSSTKNN